MKTKKPLSETDSESPSKKAKLSDKSQKQKKETNKNSSPKPKTQLKSETNVKTHKPPYDKFNKQKNMKNANGLQEKPADWNLFKKEKKELRDKRRKKRSMIEIITEAKAIGEKIRVKKLEGGTAERTKLINELHQLLGNQNNYVKFVLSHDMARIVQYMLKFGSAKIREDISAELIPSTVMMMQSKYGKFVIKRMLKYGNHDIRARCIKACYGNAVKLSSHGVSAPVFEYAYSFASNADKIALIQEFFGDMYKQTKDMNVKHLSDVYKASKDIKAAALGATKANLMKVCNKELYDSALVHSVLVQFLSECNNEDRTEIIAYLAPHIVAISNSKDGARACMKCLWLGTNKDKKSAIKAMKEFVIEMCKHEHGHTVVIALLESVDDTVLLNKAILSEMIAKVEELLADDWGRKVLAWIACSGDRSHFHPQFISELEQARAESSCKKDADVRRKEIADYCIQPILEKIAEDAILWCTNPTHMLVTSLILKSPNALENAGPAFASLAELVVEYKIKDKCFFEDSGINMALKKLIKHDSNITGPHTFGNAIIDCLNDDIIQTWVLLNRGCFLLADIYTNNQTSTQKRLKELLKPHLKVIKTQKTKGAEILLQKLA